MTLIRDYFCDYCNPSRQRREEGDEVSTGFASEVGGDSPLGWWEVPGKGPSGTTGHACPECVLHSEVAKADIVKRRSELSKRILGEEVGDEDRSGVESTRPEHGWPSHSSPFDRTGGGGDGPER